MFCTDFFAFVIVYPFIRRSLAALPSGALRLIAPARSRIVVRFRPNKFSVLIFPLTKLAGLRPRFQAASAPLQVAASAPLQVAAMAQQPEAAESTSQQVAALPAQE